ncbi:MAG TPA: tRNA pseudouridine(13) synthase TruD [Firmicutes bacterium]|nr:tRNA pseudouridine(13) synthase TruD [Candidatus Fermentithermobacillaceae bacterium]
MKIKVTPDDFVVREKVALRFAPSGRYRIYLLEKRYWNTIDALKVIARASGVRLSQIGYGGRKDRYAYTAQHISVPRECVLRSREANLTLTFLGFSDDFISARSLEANEFEVTLRSVDPSDVQDIQTRLSEISEWGFPNYFDDQRFGSVSEPGGFFAEKVVVGHYKGALKLYFTTIHPGQTSAEKQRRRAIATLWSSRDWKGIEKLSRTAVEKAICRTLCEGASRSHLVRAIEIIPREELSMFFAAYQSFLWNKTLERILTSYAGHLDSLFSVRGKIMDYRFYRVLPQEVFHRLVRLEIPTVSRKMPPTEREVEEAIRQVLEERGVRPAQFGLRDVRKVHFQSFLRSAIVIPGDFQWGPFVDDDLYPGRMKLRVKFVLPPGSFGTMLVKALNTPNRS